MCRRIQPKLVDASHRPFGAEGPFCALRAGQNAWVGGQQQGLLAARLAAGCSELTIAEPTNHGNQWDLVRSYNAWTLATGK